MATQQRVQEGVEKTTNQLHNRKHKIVSKFRLENYIQRIRAKLG